MRRVMRAANCIHVTLTHEQLERGVTAASEAIQRRFDN